MVTESGQRTSVGLYKHYKGALYRVLFQATWGDFTHPLPDDRLAVFARIGEYCLLPEERGPGLTVLWSGNATADAGDTCVIYVALYGEGRVSARTLDEFEEMVEVAVDGTGHTCARFERIGN